MATASHFITPAEYLRLERASEEKHEYVDGQMLARAGANRRHRLIMDNVLFYLRQKRSESGCTTSNSETRLYIPATGRYTYADVVMICEDEEYQDNVLDTLLNPSLIVEVLSPTTEAYDRGKKFQQYRSIPSFSEYLLVAQDEVLVEHYMRQTSLEWKGRFYQQLSDTVRLEKSAIELPLSAVYEGLNLDR